MTRRLTLTALFIIFAVSLSAAPTADLTLPVFGRLTLPHVTYKSEIVITNHRDATQEIRVDFIGRDDLGAAADIDRFTLPARSSIFSTDFLEDPIFYGRDGIGAVRLVAITPAGVPDPAGRIDAAIFVIAERPNGGTSRQEVHSIPSDEYLADHVTLTGIRHDDRAYTNVGIVNLNMTKAETFYIDVPDQEWIRVTVPAFTMTQVRLALPPIPNRSITIHPEWAVTLAWPVSPGPWAAYASTVDTITGDASTAVRLSPDLETP